MVSELPVEQWEEFVTTVNSLMKEPTDYKGHIIDNVRRWPVERWSELIRPDSVITRLLQGLESYDKATVIGKLTTLPEKHLSEVERIVDSISQDLNSYERSRVIRGFSSIPEEELLNFEQTVNDLLKGNVQGKHYVIGEVSKLPAEKRKEFSKTAPNVNRLLQGLESYEVWEIIKVLITLPEGEFSAVEQTVNDLLKDEVCGKPDIIKAVCELPADQRIESAKTVNALSQDVEKNLLILYKLNLIREIVEVPSERWAEFAGMFDPLFKNRTSTARNEVIKVVKNLSATQWRELVSRVDKGPKNKINVDELLQEISAMSTEEQAQFTTAAGESLE